METFEDKLKAMTGKDVLLAMIEGLENPVTEIDMSTFGYQDPGGVCYGCAATNAICKIANAGKEYVRQYAFYDLFGHGAAVLTTVKALMETIEWFERAVDDLRQGNVKAYNFGVKLKGYSNLILPLKYPTLPALPILTEIDYKQNLKFYKEYYANI